jgi:hypothetical protein
MRSAGRDWATGSVVAHPAANVANVAITASNSGRFVIFSNSIEFLIVVPRNVGIT